MKKGTLRILNLEDNVNDAELNKELLSARWPENHFVRVDTPEDFSTALEEGDVDLILSDFTMPGFSGREALEMARKKRPEVPFLFVSGTIGEDTAVEALKNGATDYILKHRLIRLIPAVDRALREVEERAERCRAEEAMRQSEHKYRELFECLDDAAFLVDEKTGRIIDANRAAQSLVGLERGEILGRHESKFFAPAATLPNGGIPLSNTQKMPLECELIRADNSIVSATARATRLTLYDHPLILWLCHETGEHYSA